MVLGYWVMGFTLQPSWLHQGRNQQEVREFTVLQVQTNSLQLRILSCSERFIFLNSEIIKWHSR